MTPMVIVLCYLALLLGLGIASNRFFRGTSRDFFVASQSIGSFMLLMAVFGTTMTAFALVGSTGKAYVRGIGVYGLMASASGLIHAAVFFLIGIRLWSFGKRYGYVSQIQFFRDRFGSSRFGYFLFPILVGLVIPYLLIGVLGAGKVISPISEGRVPPWLAGLVVCAVVLVYIFAGGSRGATWANTFQTLVFMVMGVVAFSLIASKLGGLQAATQQTDPAYLSRAVQNVEIQTREGTLIREVGVPPLMFLTYFFVPLSVGMFPHLFQHWLTAKSARSFKLMVIAHPICIMIVWVPCVLIGVWATGVKEIPPLAEAEAGKVLAMMVNLLVHDEFVTGLLTAGILAAIMSSLDSQFLCLGTIFTNDIVLHVAGRERFSDRQIVWTARGFIIAIVAVTYVISLVAPKNIFDLAVWCFSGFASLFPLVFAALYWKRATVWGAYASVASAMLVWFYFFHLSEYGHEYALWGGVMPVTFCFLAGAGAMVLVSLLTRPPSPAAIEKFFPQQLEIDQ